MQTSTTEAEEVVADSRFRRCGDGIHSAMIEALEVRDSRHTSSSQASASELRGAIRAQTHRHALSARIASPVGRLRRLFCAISVPKVRSARSPTRMNIS